MSIDFANSYRHKTNLNLSPRRKKTQARLVQSLNTGEFLDEVAHPTQFEHRSEERIKKFRKVKKGVPLESELLGVNLIRPKRTKVMKLHEIKQRDFQNWQPISKQAAPLPPPESNMSIKEEPEVTGTIPSPDQK